jgi:hypothetical protein
MSAARQKTPTSRECVPYIENWRIFVLGIFRDTESKICSNFRPQALDNANGMSERVNDLSATTISSISFGGPCSFQFISAPFKPLEMIAGIILAWHRRDCRSSNGSLADVEGQAATIGAWTRSCFNNGWRRRKEASVSSRSIELQQLSSQVPIAHLRR